MECILVVSAMFPTATVMFPRTTCLGDGGIVKIRLNVSDGSVTASNVTGTSIVIAVVPALKVAVIGVEV